MNSTDLDAPIVLISRVSIPRFGAKDLNFAEMASRSRGWLRITDMSFVVDPGEVANAGQTSTNDQYGALINIDAGVGRHRITNGQVPVWMLGPRLSFFGEFSSSYLITNSTNAPKVNCYTWRLPKPMLVPPGTSMGMKVSRPITSLVQDLVGDQPNAITVEVAVKGTRLARAPKVRETDIPYVTNFRTLPTTTAPILESGQGFATGGSLANPFTKELYVERFNQRTLVGNSGANGIQATDFNTSFFNAGFNNGLPPGPIGTRGPSNIRCRIFQNHYEVMSETNPKPQVFSGGTTVVPDAPQGKMLVDTVFSPQWATWRVGQSLAPKEWYNAEFSANFNFSDQSDGNGSFDISPMLALVGCRRESI